MGLLKIEDINTPALIIDLDLMEKNIETVANFFKERDCKVRLHSKFCKTPIVAWKVLSAGGARGICTAKITEAEVMAAAGIDDILIANEIVSEQKIERLARLSKWCNVKVAVDNPVNIVELSNIAQVHATEVSVLVDINLSQFGSIDGALNRCGVLPGKDALSLAKIVANTRGLKFRGLMGYEGSMSKYSFSFEKRKEVVNSVMKCLLATRDMIINEGIEVEIVSAGCTGDFNIVGAYPGVTEVQAGSYVFMDLFHEYDYGGVQFHKALTVLSTIISTPYPGRAIADVGLKGIIGTRGKMPEAKDVRGLEIETLDFEHARLILKDPSKEIRVGDRLEFYPYECDDTVNLYDKIYAVRDGKVEAEWEITARGKSQ